MPAQKRAKDEFPDMAPLIGRNLVDLRINKYGTGDVKKRRYEIAGKVGLSGSQYEKYERGDTGYSLVMLEKIAAYFGVQFTWLVTNHESGQAGFHEEAAAFSVDEKQDVTLQIIRLFQKIPKQKDRNDLLKVLKNLKP